MTAAATVGTRLREAREAAGLSPEQVWHLTRVRPAILHDLEADRFDTSGGAVYARGHVRAVARAVGIDPCPLVQAFDEQTGSHAPTLRVAPPAPVPRQRHRDDELVLPSVPVERRGRRWQTAVVLSLAVFAGLIAAGVLGGGDAPSTSATGGTPTASPRPSADPAPAPPAGPAVATLAVAAQGGASWINVSAGERTIFEGTVEDGWQQVFQDGQQLQLRIGNAAALVLACAGQQLPATGGEGEVRTVVCGPEGVIPT